MWAILQVGLAASAAIPATQIAVRDDPRVRAFVQAYGPHIESVRYLDDDVVFRLGGRQIQFHDGRMLREGEPGRRDDCDPIFYRYSLAPLTELPSAPEELPTYCADVMEGLFGRTEAEIRAHGRRAMFLDHRVFVNELLVRPLSAVERDLTEAASADRSVAEWIEGLSVAYSFIFRDIAASQTQSYHGWGMAVDLVPESYDGRHVYWRWSRVFDRNDWHRIPIEERWSPPRRVIEIFERHGFVWGGKWTHFDMIHFEYRPEIILYNRFLDEG